MSKRLPVIQRPVTRADCANVPRPCPFRECRYNLGGAKAKSRGGPPRKMSDHDRDTALEMRASGVKVKTIASHFGVSEQAIYTVLRGRKPQTHSCALDVADEGEHTQDEVADAMGITRQWVQQVEARAMAKLRRALALGLGGKVIAESDVSDYFADGPEGHTEPDHSGYDYGEDE